MVANSILVLVASRMSCWLSHWVARASGCWCGRSVRANHLRGPHQNTSPSSMRSPTPMLSLSPEFTPILFSPVSQSPLAQPIAIGWCAVYSCGCQLGGSSDGALVLLQHRCICGVHLCCQLKISADCFLRGTLRNESGLLLMRPEKSQLNTKGSALLYRNQHNSKCWNPHYPHLISIRASMLLLFYLRHPLHLRCP